MVFLNNLQWVSRESHTQTDANELPGACVEPISGPRSLRHVNYWYGASPLCVPAVVYMQWIGTVRVDDPGVIQCAIQVAIHETGSRPQNRGKGGSRIVWGSSEKRLWRRFARRSTILDSGKLILSHFCDTSSVNPVLINDFESLRLAGGVLRSPRRVTTWRAEKTGWIPGFMDIKSVFCWIQAGKAYSN